MTFFVFVDSKVILANEFLFNTETIEVLNNGNNILAKNGIVKSNIEKIEIISDSFYLDKKTTILKTTSGEVKFLDTGFNIKANNHEYNNTLSTLLATGNVKIVHDLQKLTLSTENIFFDNKKKIIRSESKTIINDKFGNNFEVESFNYSLKDNLIKINNAILIDVSNNIFNLKKAYINLNTEKLVAENISIDFNKKYFQMEGDPRLKGTTLKSNKNQTIITNGVFTPCKKNDSCPPWQLSAGEIKHDKKKKTIYYKNAWLKIYDKPVFYFPKFFHPDPTVKRQSGFLMPSFDASNSIGSSFNIPYYNVLAENKDITIKPRFFFK